MRIVALFLFGLISGSFLNVVISRLPQKESLLLPPSHCPRCRRRLGVWDLVPLLSYLWLGGRCRYCREPIGYRYPLVELLSGIITVMWGRKYGITGDALPYLLLNYFLLTVAVIDVEQKVVPDILTLPMILGGLLFRISRGEGGQSVIDAVAGGGILFLISLLYPKGMGMGDAKLLAVIGVFTGWKKALFTLFLGSFLGVMIILPLILGKRREAKEAFPFAPFLAAAAMVIIYGEEVVLGLAPAINPRLRGVSLK